MLHQQMLAISKLQISDEQTGEMKKRTNRTSDACTNDRKVVKLECNKPEVPLRWGNGKRKLAIHVQRSPVNVQTNSAVIIAN